MRTCKRPSPLFVCACEGIGTRRGPFNGRLPTCSGRRLPYHAFLASPAGAGSRAVAAAPAPAIYSITWRNFLSTAS